LSGASEAHLLAKEIGRAGVGVILNPSRPFPNEWRSRRILPGKPLTEKNALSLLMEHGVMVGFGMPEKWMTRNLRFDLAWVNYTLFCSQSEELLAHAAGCNGA